MKKKYFTLIFMLFFIGTFIYNIVLFNYDLGITNSENFSPIIGIGASICGFILGFTLFRFYQIKEKIEAKEDTI